jgi:hypothetical protein
MKCSSNIKIGKGAQGYIIDKHFRHNLVFIRGMIGCSFGNNLVLIRGPFGSYLLYNLVPFLSQFWPQNGSQIEPKIFLLLGNLNKGAIIECPLLKAAY